MITVKQELHREYLKSPLWAKKRQEALAFFGPVCNRCKKEGHDVHHKTYRRAGGSERMSDLEILCRTCHEAHHRIERAIRPRKSRPKHKRASWTAIANYLTPKQRQILMDKTGQRWPEIYLDIVSGKRAPAVWAALRMLGLYGGYASTKHAYNKPNKPRSAMY